jgi:hypothetical protein
MVIDIGPPLLFKRRLNQTCDQFSRSIWQGNAGHACEWITG